MCLNVLVPHAGYNGFVAVDKAETFKVVPHLWAGLVRWVEVTVNRRKSGGTESLEASGERWRKDGEKLGLKSERISRRYGSS